MKIQADRSLIGQDGCVIYRSIVSGDVLCQTEKITGYLVEKDRISIRFASGKWVDAEHVCAPKDTERIKKEFIEKFGA